jgi:rod shape-determining protein MreB and related proteins
MLSFFNRTFYVQVSPERLTIRNPKTGDSVSETAEVAITSGSKAKIVGVGTAARAAALDPSVKLVRPFAHPRSLVSDFTVADQLLKEFMRRMPGQSFFKMAPIVVIHPQGEPEGGFTQVEIRALHELALGAGASMVKLWQGRDLTDQELLSGSFPPNGKILS